MPELGPYGSVRGAAGNSRPYRDCRQTQGPSHALERPASEKRQGTKSRGVGHPANAGLWGFGVSASVGEDEPRPPPPSPWLEAWAWVVA